MVPVPINILNDYTGVQNRGNHEGETRIPFSCIFVRTESEKGIHFWPTHQGILQI